MFYCTIQKPAGKMRFMETHGSSQFIAYLKVRYRSQRIKTAKKIIQLNNFPPLPVTSVVPFSPQTKRFYFLRSNRSAAGKHQKMVMIPLSHSCAPLLQWILSFYFCCKKQPCRHVIGCLLGKRETLSRVVVLLQCGKLEKMTQFWFGEMVVGNGRCNVGNDLGFKLGFRVSFLFSGYF